MSQKTLIIVESPAKCKKIEDYLGKEMYKCVASYGHIRELETKSGLSCIQKDKNYEPVFKNVFRQKKNIDSLRHLINNTKDVLLATDDDREGEAIAWHICQVFNLPVKTTKRIIFHEITKTALQKAVQNPTIINMNKVYSQKARQVLDLLVGFTISPILWKQISSHNKSSLSAGRCQTPALRLVYDNECEIQKSPGKECYDITGMFTDKNIQYKLNDNIENKEEVEEFLEESVNHNHILKNENPKQISKEPPSPLTTSQLQQKASNVLNFSPKKTMLCAQNLYEAGYITYMRTDSKLYSDEFINSVEEYIKQTYGEQYVNKMINSLSLKNHKKSGEKKEETNKKTKGKNENEKSNAQEAHEAIRPTDILRTKIKPSGEKITINEVRLYDFIWSHTLKSCMSDAEFMKFLSIISAPFDKKYSKTFEKIIFKGWMIVNYKEDEKNYYEFLINLNSKKPLNYNKITANFTLKDLKQHYTEAKLISLLEQKGIGRPSTFSSLITKIQERGYVQKQDIEGKKIIGTDYELIDCEIIEHNREKVCGNEKNKMVIQPIGKIVIEFLVKNYDNIFNYDYTGNMEQELDNIESGNKQWHLLCKECDESLLSINTEINENLKKEEFIIDSEHKYKIGRYGGYIEKIIGKKKENLKLKSGISLEDIKDKIKDKTINISDLIERKNNQILGKYKDKEIIIKKGKFGIYINYDSINVSLNGLDKEISDININDVIPFIERKLNPLNDENNGNPNNKSNIVRVLNIDFSLRTGKYGNYLFYKTKDMKKPKFINIKKYSGNMEIDDKNDIISWALEQIS